MYAINQRHFVRDRQVVNLPCFLFKHGPAGQVPVHVDGVGVVPDCELAVSQGSQHVGRVIPTQGLDHVSCHKHTDSS